MQVQNSQYSQYIFWPSLVHVGSVLSFKVATKWMSTHIMNTRCVSPCICRCTCILLFIAGIYLYLGCSTFVQVADDVRCAG